MAFDSAKTSKFIRQNGRIADTDYEIYKRKFKIYSAADVINGKLAKSDVYDKIVLIGFLGARDQGKFITPPMRTYQETPIDPLEYLANIIAQILEQK